MKIMDREQKSVFTWAFQICICEIMDTLCSVQEEIFFRVMWYILTRYFKLDVTVHAYTYLQ